MKNAKKVLLLVLCAALLVSASIAGTVAYLTSKATVTNTFTVGKVAITMDEAKVNNYGQKLDENDNVWAEGATLADRQVTNTYLLVPGHEYVKDPIVYVEANSEKCYVFVKVVNGLKAYEATSNTIHSQILANQWVELDETNHPGVYYKVQEKAATKVELPVFASFTLATNAESVGGWNDIEAATATTSGTNDIVVTAYAIQFDTMTGPADAWAKMTDQLNS